MTGTPRSVRFLRGAGWHALGVVLPALASFLLVPFLIGRLGTEGYALYVLMSVLLSYSVPLTLGAGPATLKYVAELHAAGDVASMRGLMRLSWRLHLAGPLLGALAFLAVAPLVATRLLNVPQGLAETAVRVLSAAAAAAVFFNLAQVPKMCLQGLQRFRQANLLNVLESVGPPAGVAALLALGFAPVSMGAWFVVTNFLLLAAALALARPHLPPPGPARLEAQQRSRFLSFGGFNCLHSVLWLVSFQLDKAVIGSLLPLSSLTFYYIPYSIVSKLALIPAAIAAPSFPIASELQAHGDPARLQRLYLKTTKLLLLVILPPCVLLFALAPQFLTLWLGHPFSEHGTWPLRVLLIANLGTVLSFAPYFISHGLGRSDVPAAGMGLGAAGSLALWFMLIPRFGILGAALSFLASQALSASVQLWFLHDRLLRLGWSRFLTDACLKPALLAVALLAGLMVLHAQADTWLRLGTVAAAGTALYYGAGLLWLDTEDKEALWRTLRGGDR